jgi:hypothetical protein
VSRGDPELVRLPDRDGQHFPAAPDGRYAGFHPADSAAALRELERRLGEAEYLLIPASSFWWLDYYVEFADVLNTRYERVWSDADCVIFRLSQPRSDPASRVQKLRAVADAAAVGEPARNGSSKRSRREVVR